jgi:hypothetical protein
MAPRTKPHRWLLRIALVLLGVPLLLVLALFVRFTWFPPRYDVPSIAQLPDYQDEALMAQAWALPAARSYGQRVDYQSNGSLCGPTSVGNVFRSLGEPVASADAVLDGAGVCRSGFCWMGLTLDELGELARSRTRRKVTLLRDLTIESFREHLVKSNDPARRYIVNFNRGLLFGVGTGHHSPLAGYIVERDLAFVLDVNEKFEPWLVDADRLFKAMDSIDSSSGKKRGMLLVE